MSKIHGTNIAAPIVPYATSDSYPTHYAKYGKGGYVSLNTIEERNEIPEERLEEGMLVYVLEDGQSYQYLGGEWVSARVGKEDSLKFEGSSNYNARVENGIVVAYNEKPTYRLEQPEEMDEYSFIKINSFYLGYGKSNSAHNFLPCSHRFIELSNVGTNRTSLSGLFLKYYFGGTWKTIELNGIIEPGSTYLLRGEQTSVIDSEDTKIKVKQYNQIWEDNDADFSNGVLFYLCWGNEDGEVFNEKGEFIDYPTTKEDILNSLSYVDCVSTNSTSITGTGIKRRSDVALNDVIFIRKCALDPSYEDTKDNTIDWRYHFIIDDRYKPGASYEGKNLSWGNDWIKQNGSPITVTCTVGRRAEIDSDHETSASRCFTWTTKDSDCEYLFIRKQGGSWSAIPGFYGETADDLIQRSSFDDGNVSLNYTALENSATGEILPDALFEYYNRKAWETYTGEVIYTYKLLLNIDVAGTYQYRCGKMNADGGINEDCCSEIRTFAIVDTRDTDKLNYIQVGNYNINTWESAALLYQTSCGIYSNLLNTPIDFIVNTGNVVKHGNRPHEWIYYINNNYLLKWYAEFITPGENDLGEVNLYNLGNDKVNYRMMDLFYTFEYGLENLPVFDEKLMPGLYSTNYFGHIISSFNSTTLTDPDETESIPETTTRDVMGIEDTVIDLPYGANENLGINSKYYYKQLEWLYREIAYYYDIDWYRSNFPPFSEMLDFEMLVNPEFTTNTLSEEGSIYISDFITVLMNRTPVEPYTDYLNSIREESDEKTTRSFDYNTRDHVNFYLNYLTSRLFKLWQIKLVLGNCDWGVAGVTKRVFDANEDYAPAVMNNDFRELLMQPLKAYDTFQPVLVTEDLGEASDLAKSQQTRYIWNGTGYVLNIYFDSGGYTSIQPKSMEASGLVWDGKYSILVAGRDNSEYRNDTTAPRYAILNSSLNQFTLHNNKTENDYTWSDSEYVWPWFEVTSGTPISTEMIPTFILHSLPCKRIYAESLDKTEGNRTISYKGISPWITRTTNVIDVETWNTEEDCKMKKSYNPLTQKYIGTELKTLLTINI